MAQDINQKQLKIAVVAVHGVADQLPSESARAIANLLINHNRSEKEVQYTPFYEYPLRVAVRPVRNVDKAKYDDKLKQSEQKSLPNERGAYTTKCLKNPEFELDGIPKSDVDTRLDKRSHEFMEQQLSQYKGEGVKSTYESIRLEGKRLGEGNEYQPDVHVYEMYWADLSRLGTGFFRIFSEFYQLLFHLSSLGRGVVERARDEHQDNFGKDFWWISYSNLQAWADQKLSVFIPLLNLYLLVTVLITLPGNIPGQYLPLVVWGSLGLVGIGAIGYWGLWRKPKVKFPIWATLPVLLAIGAIAAGAFSVLNSGDHVIRENFTPSLLLGDYRILAIEWCSLLALGVWYLMRRYKLRRPDINKIPTYTGSILVVVISLLLLFAENSHIGITNAAFKVNEVVYLLLVVSWLVFGCLQFLAALLGWILVKTAAKGDKEIFLRTQQAAWMGRITLAVPSALFLVVTIALWMGLDRVGSRLLPQEEFYTPWLLPLYRSQTLLSGYAFLHQQIIAAASPLFILVLSFILAAIILAVWSLLPVAWAEVVPPKSDQQSAQQYGQWLTKGFQLLNGSSFLIFLAMGFVFPIGCGVAIFAPQLVTSSELNETILGIFATLIVASATSLLAFGGRLNQLSLGFRSVLDLVLDVDSYMRLHPMKDNPRARICARYVSLLRYLCKWSDPEDGKGYDALVIVAHSQGTVITADLLRFLKYQRDKQKPQYKDPGLTKLWSGNLPIYFFTMGCPLRQLYALGFPHLYNWARHYDKTHWKQKPHDPQHINKEQKPDPKQLIGVERWVNTFRSGDYVGRYLWRSDICDYQWSIPAKTDNEDPPWTSKRDRPVYVSEDQENTRREFCLGAGAHTHYWDGISDEVAAELDVLICEACDHALKSTKTV